MHITGSDAIFEQYWQFCNFLAEMIFISVQNDLDQFFTYYGVGIKSRRIWDKMGQFKFSANQIDIVKLRQTILKAFNEAELRVLCFDLQINYEELSPGGIGLKVQQLVEYCQRHGHLQQLVDAILKARPHIEANTFVLQSADEAPFKGLQYFDEEDEEWFFGRDHLIAKLVGHLRDNSFLALVGSSGSGKSSLVRAGLVPTLRHGRLQNVPQDSIKWPIHIITPTATPIKTLATTLTRDSESVTATTTLMDDMRQDGRSLDLYVHRLLTVGNHRLLLVIDQFEELFTLCKDAKERQDFVDNLIKAVNENSRLVLLITLRADFYPQCLQYESLHQLLEKKQKIVPAMSSEDLRQIIELPAHKTGLNYEDGLVDLLLRDVGNEPGALPLLSHALLETWRRRDGNKLTLGGYTAAGGVHGAIAKTADSVYEQLDEAQKSIAYFYF